MSESNPTTWIRSFYKRNVGLDEGSLKEVVESATNKADDYITSLEDDPDFERVKVVSSSTQLAIEGNYAAYVITLVIELTYRLDEEEE